MENYKVSLDKVIKEIELDTVYVPMEPQNIYISTNDVNRPGLLLSGFLEFFQKNRVQVLGKMEHAYLNTKTDDEIKVCLGVLFSQQPPCVIVTGDQKPFDCMIEMAKKYEVPLLSTTMSTSNLISFLVRMLSVELAPRLTMHGVFVEVYGEGVLITGLSGVGKSETAIELVHRGH
ncbi:MAG: HPr(Ser) kinase/phosphatase, partial [Oscillospiraceae bacterium]